MDDNERFNDNFLENVSQQEYYSNDNKQNGDIPNDINFIMREPEIKKPNRRRKKSIMSYIAVALVAAIIGGMSGSYIAISKLNNFAEKQQEKSTISAQEVKINLTDDVYFAAAVAENSQKTVVGITTEVEQQNKHRPLN